LETTFPRTVGSPYYLIAVYTKNMDIKWQISLFSALIFLLVVHPMTYKLTQKLFGGILGKIADPSGCPTTVGLALHTIVYILLVRGSMDFRLF
jgi:hypothetical protein